MFNPEDLLDIERLNSVADEITTRQDMGQSDDEGEEEYKEYKKAPQDEDKEEEDTEGDIAYDS